MRRSGEAAATVDIDATQLKQLFYDFIQAALQRFIALGLWPRPPAERYIEVGRHFVVPDVEHLPELKRLHEYFEASEFIKRHYYPQSIMLWTRLLGIVLAETDGDRVRVDILAKHFRRYFRELARPYATWRQVDTITGLRCERAFNLDGHSVVTPLADPSHHLRAWVDFGGLGPSIHDRLALVTTVTVEKQSLWSPPHELGFPERGLALVGAVRLLKPGVPRLHCHANGQLSSFRFERPSGWGDLEGEPIGNEKEAAIESKDIPRVRALWKDLLPRYQRRWAFATREPRIDIPLRRFGRAYENTWWLDRVVDLTVAIEALIGPSDQQELRHRVALRAAHLLGSRGNPSQVVYECVRTMYDARSTMVHGRRADEKQQAKWLSTLSGLEYDYNRGIYPLIEPALETAREIVSRLIRGCMKLASESAPQPSWPLPDDFDRLILEPSERRLWQRKFQL